MKRSKKTVYFPIRLPVDLDRIVNEVAIERNVTRSEALRFIIREYSVLRSMFLEKRIDRMQFNELMSKVTNIEEVLNKLQSK